MTPNVEALTTREACLATDQSDPLAKHRSEFALPKGVIYLDGNSLGPLPKAARSRALHVLEEEWGRDLISSWNTNDWFKMPYRIGAKIGELIGGGAGECVVTDTTSINVFKALAAALRIQQQDAPDRRVIVSERGNFPTDLYMLEGLIDALGEVDGRRYELRLVDSFEGDTARLEAALNHDVAAVLLTHVNYRTGAMWPIDSVTQIAQHAGALMIWDLCHSAGAVPVDLERAGADFAVGCTYKYLNGGPGSPAFVWAGQRHLHRIEQPLSGWWAHARPFAMTTGYEPGEGAARFMVGTQPILSMSTMEVGVDLALSVDEGILRAKSLALTSLFMRLVAERIPHHPLTLVTPQDTAIRGSHVSFEHPDGFAVMKALIARGVIGDYREPSVLRFGLTPLYIGYADVWDAVETLREVLDSGEWRAPEFQQRGAVT